MTHDTSRTRANDHHMLARLARAPMSIGFWVALTLGALLVFYIVPMVLFFASTPRTTRNFVAEFMTRGQAAPPEERAESLYLRAIEIVRHSESLPHLESTRGFNPAHPEWNAIEHSTRRLAPVFDVVRQAAAMPVLGLDLSRRDWWAWSTDPAIHEKLQASPIQPEEPTSLTFNKNLEEAAVSLSFLAIGLALDAEIAANTGDIDRFVANIEAIVSFCVQTAEWDTKRFMSVPLRRLRDALLMVQPMLLHGRASLSDEHVARLALALRRAAPLLSPKFANEHLYFEEWIHGGFAVNSRGEGRATSSMLMSLVMNPMGTQPQAGLFVEVHRLVFRCASPRKLAELHRRMIDLFAELVAIPPGIREQSAQWREFASLSASIHAPHSRYWLLGEMPILTLRLLAFDLHRELFDRVSIALAIERYRRAHAREPASLTSLVPDFLDAVPLDPVDGQPLRSMIVNGWLVAYSIGANRLDDGGSFGDGRDKLFYSSDPSPLP